MKKKGRDNCRAINFITLINFIILKFEIYCTNKRLKFHNFDRRLE